MKVFSVRILVILADTLSASFVRCSVSPIRPNPLFTGRNGVKMLPIRPKPRSTGREAIETVPQSELFAASENIRIFATPSRKNE